MADGSKLLKPSKMQLFALGYVSAAGRVIWVKGLDCITGMPFSGCKVISRGVSLSRPDSVLQHICASVLGVSSPLPG